MIWKFTLDGTIIDEPIGWDALEIDQFRSQQFYGMDMSITSELKFWGHGADLIIDKFEQYGFDGILQFMAEYSCDGGTTYSTFFTGIINCSVISILNSEVTAKIDRSAFYRTALNRLDTPVNLNSNISIDGLPMSTINPYDLGLHSKEIIKQGTLVDNQVLNHITSDEFKNNDDILCYFPLQIDIGEISQLNEVNTLFVKCAGGCESTADPIFSFNPVSGETVKRLTVKYKLKGTLRFRPPDGEVGEYNITNFDIYAAYGNISTDNQIHLYSTTGPSDVLLGWPDGFGNYLSYDINIDISGSFNINSPSNSEKIFFYAILNTQLIPDTDVNNFVLEYIFDSSSFIDINLSSTYVPSICKAFLIHETFAKICESITGVQDCFRSDFFGRTNSAPHAYSEDGCGAWAAITNGLNIRKMLDKNGNYFPIVTSFNDLYKALDSILLLGMNIETIGGKEYIRVEPREHFYNANTIFNAFNVSDLKRSVAIDKVFNGFTCGYSKWNLNITGSNGIDEFNSERTYSIPVKLASSALSNKCNFISSGYAIEQTRRIQYLTNPSSDWELDNNIFLICTNRAPVTTDKYTYPPVNTTYGPGLISERDENFSGITNILSPDTCYNLRISPARIALNWYKWLSASIYKIPLSSIKFTSGTGNFQMSNTMINDCIVSATVHENQNLIPSQLSGENSHSIYLPEYLEFTYPMSFDEYINVFVNSNNAIGVSCNNGALYIGFKEDFKYKPTTDGGEAEFKLTRGICIPGSFNDDFNNDFDIGNC